VGWGYNHPPNHSISGWFLFSVSFAKKDYTIFMIERDFLKETRLQEREREKEFVHYNFFLLTLVLLLYSLFDVLTRLNS
jgi:hypothetical protein